MEVSFILNMSLGIFRTNKKHTKKFTSADENVF